MTNASSKPVEPEEVSMLRHRFGRTIEIWTAYNVFLSGEVEVGPDKTCLDSTIVDQTTHTLLIAFYSFVYSLFDPSGVSFPKISQSMLDELTPVAREARAIVVSTEQKIHSELGKIRSNIGFHQGNRFKKHDVGYLAYKAFHPLAPMVIMQGMRVFFREVAKTHEPYEPYALDVSDEDTLGVLQYCRDMKKEVDENQGADLPGMLEGLGRRLGRQGARN